MLHRHVAFGDLMNVAKGKGAETVEEDEDLPWAGTWLYIESVQQPPHWVEVNAYEEAT